MLEKEQKYKQLMERVSKINQFQQNFIQCMSTIKITLIQLINEFFKPTEDSILKKIQYALLSSIDAVNEVCLNLSLKVQSRLFNYQNEIANLSKKYKEQLQQMIHYRKKVQSIKKAFLQTREDKEKLQRNIDKKRCIEKQCMKTEKLLVKNYENFQIQVQKLLKQCPQQILFQFIEGNFLAYSKLSSVIGQQKPAIRNRLRQCSILSVAMSDISDFDGSDKISQNSDNDFNNQDQIQIIIEPQSTQTMQNGSEIIQININEDTSDGQNYLHITNPNKYDDYKTKKLKRSLLRKASIEHNIKNKEINLQKIKEMIGYQNDHSKKQSFAQLDKAFEKVQSPVSQQNRRQKIFKSIKNRFSDHKKKIIIQKIQNIQKPFTNPKDDFHQKSFIFSKQEFKNNHSPTNHKKMDAQGQKRYIKNQQTLNHLPQNDASSKSTSKNQQSSSASLSSIMQRKNHVFKVQEKRSKQLQSRDHLKKGPPQNIIKQHSCNQQHKENKNKIQNIRYYHESIQPRQHAVSNYQCTTSYNLSNQNLQGDEDKKYSNKLGQQEKNRVMEQLFSVAALKNKKNNPQGKNSQINKKQIYLTTENNKQTDPKNWFSTTFLYPQNNNSCPKTPKNENIQHINNMQHTQRFRTNSTRLPQNENKIDFSIFSKIV